MRFLLTLFTLLSASSFAGTFAQCELVDGIYVNSSTEIHDMNFETIVDVFTLNNANALNLTLDGNPIRFIRSDLSVNKQTKMIFLQRKENKVVRAIRLMIDRTPKEVIKDREFYGNMIISPEMKDGQDFTKVLQSKNLVYNFRCNF